VSSTENHVGKKIGNYILTSLLGSGNFGSVYLALHQYLERKTAIKLLNQKYLSDNQARAIFFQEAKILEMLRHRYVLPIIDVGQENIDAYPENVVPYIITEFAPAGSLEQHIRNNPRRPMWEALLIISQVGQALHYAHQNNVIHRDINPRNILFNDKTEAVLADFGISVLADYTVTFDKISGTIPYMAPEQFAGKVSVRSDQYALACVAYELFTGERPIKVSRHAGFEEWAHKIATGLPMPPSQLNPDVPYNIDQAILKALSKDRHQRFEDVGKFIAALVSDSQLVNIAYLPTLFSIEEMQHEVPDHSAKTLEQLLKEGSEYYSDNNLEEALAAYEQAIRIAPDRDILHNVKGKVLFDLQRFQEAIEAYSEAIRLAPQKAVFHINQGDALRQLRAYHDALAAYEQAIALRPINAIAAKACAGRGDVHLKLGQEKEALRDYERACDLEQDKVLWHRHRGDLLRQLQRYPEALAAYERALQLAPQDKALLTRKEITLQKIKKTQP
jgi:serine/threonine protein kinase